jgi:UDP-N-acetylglucosamine 3-dehydrogenase
MNNQVCTVLVGLGNIGQHHLRILKASSQVNVCAVVDFSEPVVEGVKVFASIRDFWSAVDAGEVTMPDAAIVATPIPTHYEIASQLLERGLHVFVEKPITPTYAEAWALMQLAHQHGKVLFVGHSERYNPAFTVFLAEFRKNITGQVYRIECNRTGPYPQRVGDSGATIDLAVHDLDSLCAVMQDAVPEWVFARMEQRIHPTQDDGLNAMIGYAPDIVVALTVNWLSPRKNRYLNVYGHQGMLQCDFYLQKVTFFENLYRRSRADEYGIGGIEVGAEVDFVVPKWEPLAKEHEHFFATVKAGGLGDGQEALKRACMTIRLANMLQQSSRENRQLEWPK